MAADGSIIIDTKIDQAGLTSGLDKMRSAVKIGVAAVVGAIGAMSIAVVGLGSEFEMANAAASTLFGDAQVNMSQYQGKMLELSNKTGLAASELGMTMYDALSSGIPASDDMSEALGFLEQNTKLAKAGFTDINTATTATAKVLNAYKMDVGETDRVHKILMQTQNKGITTVNELGSVLSQVTPTASAMSVSFEQVGAALAGMTAQGTPTAQATTQLNQLIAELGKSGTQANTAMTDMYEGMGYGKKTFKELMEEGVTLADIIVDMEGYAEENDKALIDMFGSLEAGKAALSMAGDNAKTFTSNLDAMSTSTDVVGDAYDKITDTFKEKSVKVVNSLKNVGIAAYEKFEQPLKKSMDVAQTSVDNLSTQMSNGKLGKSVDTIADAFGELIEVTANLASKVIPILIDSFAFIIDNGKIVTSVLAGIATATIYYKNQEVLLNTVHAVSTSLKNGLTIASYAYEAAQLASASGLGFVASAQAGVNMAMSLCPINWLVVGVGALAAGLVLLCTSLDDEKSTLQKNNEAVVEAKESYNDLKASKQEALDASLQEINGYQDLKKELDFLVDANGRVKEGYEGRANYIVTTLNEACGTEMKLIDGTIDKYKEASVELDSYIEKMKASAIIEAQAEALKKAEELYKTNQETLKSINVDIEKSQNSLNKRMKELRDEGLTDAQIADDGMVGQYQYNINEFNAQKENILGVQNGILTDKATYYNNLELFQEGGLENLKTVNSSEIAEYDEQKGRISKSLTERAENEILNVATLNDTISKTKDENHKKQLIREAEMSAEKLGQMQEDLKSQIDTVKGATPEQQKVYNDLAIARLTALKSKSTEYFGVSEAEMDDLISGLKSKDPKVNAKAKKTAEDMLTNLKSKEDEYSKAGVNAINGVIAGVGSKSSEVYGAMAGIGLGMVTTFRNSLVIKSPSRKFAEVSKYIPEGIKKGIEDNSGVAVDSIESLSNDMVGAFEGVDMSSAFETVKQAIYAEQMKMAAVVDTQAKIEIMRTSVFGRNENNGEETNDAKPIIIENHLYLDGRELTTELEPFISNQLALNVKRRR